MSANGHCCEFMAWVTEIGFFEYDNGYYYLGQGWFGQIRAGDPVFLLRCPECGACLDE